MCRNILKSPALLCIVMMLAIFLLGLMAPREASETTLYVLVVLVSLRSSDGCFILGILLLCTVLTVTSFFISGASVEVWEAVANRVFAILAFWVVGLVGWKRIQLEARLRESELHYRDVLDHMLEGAQILDFEWRYVYVNDSVTKHARQSRQRLLGHTIMDVYPDIEGTELFDFLRHCMDERRSNRREIEFVYPDGETAWFEISGTMGDFVFCKSKKKGEAILAKRPSKSKRTPGQISHEARFTAASAYADAAREHPEIWPTTRPRRNDWICSLAM